jgi:hypothetical protein
MYLKVKMYRVCLGHSLALRLLKSLFGGVGMESGSGRRVMGSRPPGLCQKLFHITIRNDFLLAIYCSCRYTGISDSYFNGKSFFLLIKN